MKMLSSQLSSDIISFIKEFNKLRYSDINGKSYMFLQKYSRQVIFAIISGVMTYFYDIITSSFIDYIKDILSIFVGLFLTVLVFAYDKFNLEKPEFSNEDKVDADERKSLADKLQIIRRYNYAKKFVYAVEYNIILGTIVLGLLILPLDFPKFFQLNFSGYVIADDLFSIESWELFAHLLFAYIIKALALYIIIQIFYYTLYSVLHLGKYMNSK